MVAPWFVEALQIKRFEIHFSQITWFTYVRGGQLVFDWDRLENFSLTRDRPVGKKVSSTKCQS